ncbi:hypothetical protein [Flavobacterium sp.]|uniref:hypothetical protein n=1 Tax=Flavobacterium sp. TaxID=239 RepID=UPI0026393D2D|nr:hypothetical protein [Flavobacterium sp.]
MKTESNLSLTCAQFSLFDQQELPTQSSSNEHDGKKGLNLYWLNNLQIAAKQVSLFEGEEDTHEELPIEGYWSIASAVWDDVVELIGQRINKNPSIDLAEFYATLGWLMGWWNGAIPLSLVLAIETDGLSEQQSAFNVDSIQYLVKKHLQDDIDFLKAAVIEQVKRGGYRA